MRKKIGIKYCGGCNPGYERVEMMERVQTLMEDQILFLKHDHHNLDGLVLVNGCPKACANENQSDPTVPSRSIIGENDMEDLINWLRSTDVKGEKR